VLLLLLVSVAGGTVAAESAGCDGPAAVVAPSVGGEAPTASERSVTQLNVTINGEHVASGERVTTTDDPRLAVTVTSQARISLLSLRVDGRTHRSYTPNTTNFSHAVTLDLRSGPHDVEIVVKTPDDVNESRLTVIEDSAPPTMQFTKPISVAGVSLEESYDVERSRVTIAGTIQDRSNVTKVEIEHTYRYTQAGQSEGGHNRTVVRNPNGSISWPVQLIPPQQTSTETANQIEITLHDQFDQIRQYEFNLTVTDNTRPEIAITDLEALYRTSEVRVNFSVSDAAAIRSVRVSTTTDPNVGRNLLLSLDPEEQPVEADFTHTVAVDEGSPIITLVATDASGQERVVSRELNYSALITPKTRLETRRTRFRGEDRVSAVGTISEGKITRVRVETVAPNGTVLDIQTVHSGTVVSHVEMNETLQAETDIYPVRVRVRTLDITGAEYLESVTLSRPSITRTQTETAPPQSTTERLTRSPPRRTTATPDSPPIGATNWTVSKWLPLPITLAAESTRESGLADIALLIVTLMVGLLLLFRL
jgi:hypothetical protein